MNSENMQEHVAQEVNRRINKATEELKAKYSNGLGGNDYSVDGPTGSAYKEKYLKEQREKKHSVKTPQDSSEFNHFDKINDNEDDPDEDHELRKLREKRLSQIKKEHNDKLENLSKGHGQYREITQDEFLREVTSSFRVVCHFYHRDFPRCEIMDHHLSKIASTHIETKFIKINAEKAPFFVDKLKIRTIPTLVLFFDGLANEKVLGFEELSDSMPEGKEDEWPTIKLSLLLSSKKIIDPEKVVDEDQIAADKLAEFESMRKLAMSNFAGLEDDFDDLDEDDN